MSYLADNASYVSLTSFGLIISYKEISKTPFNVDFRGFFQAIVFFDLVY